jgi:catechol 2,3-dioxygenase-like lactoylglutathione lyase family enzyme
MPIRAGIHHLDLSVSDLERSARFYDRVLTRIGYRRIDLSATGSTEYDWAPIDGDDRFSIGLYVAIDRNGVYDRHAPGIHHLALRAKSRAEVDDLYRELHAMNAEILDVPAEYPKYEPGYYAVFFRDPDGIKLEYVFTPVANQPKPAA